MSRGEYTPRYLVFYAAVFAFLYALFQWVPSLWAEVITAQSSSRMERRGGLVSTTGTADTVTVASSKDTPPR